MDHILDWVNGLKQQLFKKKQKKLCMFFLRIVMNNYKENSQNLSLPKILPIKQYKTSKNALLPFISFETINSLTAGNKLKRRSTLMIIHIPRDPLLPS